jgi:hypothetical protein
VVSAIIVKPRKARLVGELAVHNVFCEGSILGRAHHRDDNRSKGDEKLDEKIEYMVNLGWYVRKPLKGPLLKKVFR